MAKLERVSQEKQSGVLVPDGQWVDDADVCVLERELEELQTRLADMQRVSLAEKAQHEESMSQIYAAGREALQKLEAAKTELAAVRVERDNLKYFYDDMGKYISEAQDYCQKYCRANSLGQNVFAVVLRDALQLRRAPVKAPVVSETKPAAKVHLCGDCCRFGRNRFGSPVEFDPASYQFPVIEGQVYKMCSFIGSPVRNNSRACGEFNVLRVEPETWNRKKRYCKECLHFSTQNFSCSMKGSKHALDEACEDFRDKAGK